MTKALGVAQQTAGKSLPQVRKYHANLSTNFYLAGITDHPLLRKFNIGGAIRWEDRGAIGCYGVQQLPDIITDLDANRPIWDKGHTYVDLLAAYRTKLLGEKVDMTVPGDRPAISSRGARPSTSSLLRCATGSRL